MNKKKVFGIIKITAYILVFLFLFLIVASLIGAAVTDKPLPTLFGYGACFVVSGSMEPALSVNDVIIVKYTDSPQIKDMVLYQSNGALVVHRVINISDDGETIVTMGDANDTPDPPFDRSLIVGRVIYVIPALGQIIAYLKSPYGISAMLMIMVFLYIATYLLKQYVKEKGKEKSIDADTVSEAIGTNSEGLRKITHKKTRRK